MVEWLMRRAALEGFGDVADVGRCGATASSHYVETPLRSEAANVASHLFGRNRIPSLLVGQSGIGIIDGEMRNGIGYPFYERGNCIVGGGAVQAKCEHSMGVD